MLTPGVWVPEWLLTVVLPDSSHSASSNRPSWSGDDFSLEEPKRLLRRCLIYSLRTEICVLRSTSFSRNNSFYFCRAAASFIAAINNNIKRRR